jgi:tetratricopeptide (TPR) repeat protein
MKVGKTAEMMTVSDSLTQARRFKQAGDYMRAEQVCRVILQTEPANLEALHLLGICLHASGNLAEAAEQFQKLLRFKPSAEVHGLLAIALARLGRLDEAIADFNQALQLDPNDARIHYNLGTALLKKGRFEEAIASFQRAVQANPAYAGAHNNLGEALRCQGRVEEAIVSLTEAVRLKPNFPEAHNNLGNALFDLGRVEEAKGAYQQALHLRPDYAEAHNNLGIALRVRGSPDEALAEFQHALRLKPDYAEAHNNLGLALLDQGRFDDAKACYQEALRLKPDFAEALTSLGALYKVQGKADEALRQFRQALQCKPDFPLTLYNLSEMASQRRYQFSPEEVESMQRLVQSDQLGDKDACRIHYALGAISDKAGEYDQAFEHYQQANQRQRAWLSRAGLIFTSELRRTAFDHGIAFFTPSHFQRTAAFGVESDLPVFIVGMPRSGTTLIAQILSSHPRVRAAGELKDMGCIAETLPGVLQRPEPYPHCLAYLNQESARFVAHRHLERLRQLGGTRERVIDKMPFNFQFLGLIATLFPKSKIIHCRRDPLDTGLSCYFQNFQEITFATSLAEIGDYYRDYERLMNHWRKVLPLRMLEVNYESLVGDVEAVSREMISFLGLEWSERCLEFTENSRPVRTASVLQVRQPIYRSSIGRWKRYAKHLRPLMDSLGLPGPSIKAPG